VSGLSLFGGVSVDAWGEFGGVHDSCQRRRVFLGRGDAGEGGGGGCLVTIQQWGYVWDMRWFRGGIEAGRGGRMLGLEDGVSGGGLLWVSLREFLVLLSVSDGWPWVDIVWLKLDGGFFGAGVNCIWSHGLGEAGWLLVVKFVLCGLGEGGGFGRRRVVSGRCRGVWFRFSCDNARYICVTHMGGVCWLKWLRFCVSALVAWA